MFVCQSSREEKSLTFIGVLLYEERTKRSWKSHFRFSANSTQVGVLVNNSKFLGRYFEVSLFSDVGRG